MPTDPRSFYGYAHTEILHRDYIKSKEKLTGILRSMTSKELDEKLEQLFTLQLATRDAAFDLLPNPPSAAERNAFDLANPIVDTSCPLQLWRNIVFLITTKTTGSKRLDQDNAIQTFATLRQRTNESISDFAQRVKAAVDTYILLKITAPTDENQATRFVQGLDPARYSTMQTHFMNELNNGRDIYPTDLTSAVCKANRWLVPSARGPQDVAQHTAFSLLKSKQGDKKDKKTHDRKASTKGAPADKAEKTDKSAKCAYCGKAGHNILVCFKLIADQAAAKSDGTHNKKIAAAISTRVTEDMEEETGFTCYPAITRTLIPVKQLEIILKNPTISTSNLNVFTAGSQSNLSPTDVILDTGANCSIVHNSQLLSNMSTCNPVTFDGLSGSINIT